MDDRSGDRRGGREDHDGDRDRGRPNGPPETGWLDLELSRVIAGRADAFTRAAAEELLKDAIKARIRERLGARLDAAARVAADAFVDDIEANLAIEAKIGARREARRGLEARFEEALRGVTAPQGGEGEGGPPGERTEAGGWDPRRVQERRVANIGYIQVVRHCNHFCGFCSNPTTPYVHTFETMKVLVDDLKQRGYFGVILTGGEPSLHPELPSIARYASDQGLHVRMITNGWRLADDDFARDMAEAGLKLAHVSIYSVKPEVEARLRGLPGTLDKAFAAIDNARKYGIEVNVNCVINRLNADHLDHNIRHFLERHPHVRHFVWNNLDPSMGRAEVNQAEFTPRLADFEVSLHRAMRLLHASGRTFRVEKVPLCYMTEFAWASTETRKIVKGEERIVHFLDAKQTVRQTDWEHIYAPSCDACSLRTICGGLFDRGAAYDPAELYPVFVSRDAIVEAIIKDPRDPSYEHRTLADWQKDFDVRIAETLAARSAREARLPEGEPRSSLNGMQIEGAPAVGMVTEQGIRLYAAKRRSESKKAAELGVSMEKTELALPPKG